MNFLLSPIQEMGRGCCFGIGCLVGVVALVVLVLLFFGIVNIARLDWAVDLLEKIFG